MSATSASTDSRAPIAIDRLFEELGEKNRVTVVTPNQRLAATLKDQFDASRRLAGLKAWAAADIIALATFVERGYRALCLRDVKGSLPSLLNGAQSQLLWEQVLRATDVSNRLLSIAQTAAQAASAWRVAHAWQLLPGMQRTALSEDAEVFLGWTQRFRQLSMERNVIDAPQLLSMLTTLMQGGGEHARNCADILPLTLFTAGFDIITPQQRNFLGACSDLGVSVWSAESARDVTGKCCRFEFANDEAELRACAAWARHSLQMKPDKKIAIVVPDLGARRGAITRAITDSLQPGSRATSPTEAAPAQTGFNVSLGPNLNEYALVHDALSLIALSQNRPLPFTEVSALLRSPFIGRAASEMSPRARLDAALRAVVAPEVSLFTLQRKLKLPTHAELARAVAECPALVAFIDQAVALVGPDTGRASARNPRARKPSPRDWSRHFGQVLLSWAFPGDDPLDSVDHQVLEKLRDSLATLALLEAVQPRMRADEALNHLRRIVADTVFQAETEPGAAPIQVLGILESAGQNFDSLWVMGLSEDAWPLAVRPNPFIPASLQRAAGVPEASAADSLALDKRLTEAWLKCAPEVVFSHSQSGDAGKAGEQPRAASALTRGVPLVELLTLAGGREPTLSTDYAQALFRLSQRELIPEIAPLALVAPAKVRGGASVIRDQAACPFRAFARHRLGTRALSAPKAGLDAAERGTLLHRVLALVWNRLETHAKLMALDETATAELVNETVNQALAEAKGRGMDGLTGRFSAMEHERLAKLVTRWLDYERERAPFKVVASEQARDVSLSGLSMHLRLDRLDRLDDGTHALIDYKTGVAKVASWLGERPDEPQLPLYFHTAEQTVSALAFARVKRGTRAKVFGFEGVSAAGNLLPDVAPIETKYGMEKKGYVSWDVLIATWETSLTALAKGFMAGDAKVDPKNGGLTCAQCDLSSVCRIAELVGIPLPEDDVVADDGVTGGEANDG